MEDGRAEAFATALRQDLPLLAEQYGLGQMIECSFLPQGLMNPNWRVRTQAGTFALKLLTDVTPEKAERNLTIPTALATVGIPACGPVPTLKGALVQRTDGGRAYALFQWAAGAHEPGWRLEAEQVVALGDLLGRMHGAMGVAARDEGWPAPREVRATVTHPAKALVSAAHFLDLIADLAEPGSFDRQAGKDLQARLELIGKHADSRPGDDVPLGPCGWTHGDVQYRNLLWDGGRVSAVLDWDRVAVRPLSEEVVRTALVQFAREDGELDLLRVRQFVWAYRAQVPLAGEHLADAARRLWWRWLTDLWPMQWHYERFETSCDQLWIAQSRLMDWWCEHRVQIDDALTDRNGDRH
jgi:homoserine kinase type II